MLGVRRYINNNWCFVQKNIVSFWFAFCDLEKEWERCFYLYFLNCFRNNRERKSRERERMVRIERLMMFGGFDKKFFFTLVGV